MAFGEIDGWGEGTMGSQKCYRISNNAYRTMSISGRRVQDPFITRFGHKSGESLNLTLPAYSVVYSFHFFRTDGNRGKVWFDHWYRTLTYKEIWICTGPSFLLLKLLMNPTRKSSLFRTLTYMSSHVKWKCSSHLCIRLGFLSETIVELF